MADGRLAASYGININTTVSGDATAKVTELSKQLDHIEDVAKKNGDAFGVYMVNKIRQASKETEQLEAKLGRASKMMMNTSGSPNTRAFQTSAAAYEQYNVQLSKSRELLAQNVAALNDYARRWEEFADDAQEAGNTVDEALQNAGNSTEGLKSSLANVGKMMAAAFTLDKAIQFGKEVFNYRAEMQSLEMSFTTMLQSKERADALLKEAVQFSATTPFDLQQVATATKQMLAFGSASEDIIGELRMLGDVAAGLAIPLGDLIYLYGTLRASGRVTTIDIRQFAQRGIPIYDELAKVLGVAKSEIDDLASAGKVGFNDIEQAFKNMTATGSQFGGLMDNLSKTFEGRVSNIGDALYQMKNDIGKALEEPISKALSLASMLVDNYKKIGQVIGDVVIAFGAYKAAVMAMAAAQTLATVGTSSLTVALTLAAVKTKALTAAQTAFNAVMKLNPYAMAATSMALLVRWSLRYNDAINDGTEAQKRFNERQQQIEDTTKERNANQEKLVKIIEDETAATDKRIYAMRDLLSSYPELMDKYSNEYDALSQIKDIKQEIAILDLEQAFKNDSDELDRLIARRRELEGKVADTRAEMFDSETADYAVSALALYNDELKVTNQQIELQRQKLSDPAYDVLQNGPMKPANITEQNVVKDKAYWESQLETAQAQLNKLASDQLQTQVAKDLQATITKAKAEIEKYSQKKPSTTEDSVSKTVDDYFKKLSEYELKAAQEVYNADAEIAKLRIKAQEDGMKKSLELLELEHQQKLNDINANYKRELETVKAQELELYKAKHGGSSEGFSFDASTSAMAQNVSKTYNAKTRAENEKYNADRLLLENQSNERLLSAQLDYLKSYGSYKQKEYAITKSYDEQIAKADNDYTKMILGKEKANALYELQKQYLGVYQLIFERASNLSNNQLVAAIDATQEAIKKASESGDIKALSELYDQLREKREELGSRMSGWGFSSISKGFSLLTEAEKQRLHAEVLRKYEYYDEANITDQEAFSNEEQAIKNIRNGAEQIKDVFGQIGDALSSFGGTIGEIGNVFQALADSADSITDFIDNYDFKSGTIKNKGVAYASILEGTLSIVSMIGDSISANKKAQEEWNQTIDESVRKLDKLRLDALDYTQANVFGVESPYSKAIAGAKQYAESLRLLNEYSAKLGQGRVQTGTKKAVDWKNAASGTLTGAGIGAAVGSIIPGLGTALGAAVGAGLGAISGLFSTKTVAVYSNLADKYGKLYDDEYNLLPEILADYDKMDDATKALVDGWEDVRAKMLEAKENITDTIESLVGDMGKSLSDTLVAAFQEGDIYNAIDDIQAYVESTIGHIIEQMVFAAYFQDLFDQVQSEMEASLSEGGDQSIVDDIKRFNERYKERLEGYNQAMIEAQDEAAKEGYKLWNTDAERQAGIKSSATASQDSINELNGRATSIQGSVAEINESVLGIRSQNNDLVVNTFELLHVAMGIHNDTSAINDRMESLSGAVASIKSDISWIRDRGLKY